MEKRPFVPGVISQEVKPKIPPTSGIILARLLSDERGQPDLVEQMRLNDERFVLFNRVVSE